MNEEEKAWRNRFSELARRAYERGRYAFTDILSLAEVQYLYAAEKELGYAGIALWGGFDGAERQVARFGRCDYEEAFPVVALKISPSNVKFAEPLTHRDYLGALVNLGIERSTLGDICAAENGAYLYCLERIAPFIEENLKRVRHTDVSCERAEKTVFEAKEKNSEILFVSSLRADCAVAAVFHLSRTDAAAYFEAERVFINGRVCTRASRELNAGDGVTVRGKGRFVFAEIVGGTKKGRLRCRIEKDV